MPKIPTPISLIAIAAATLVGCGGGGGDASPTPGQAPGPDTGTNTAPAPAPAPAPAAPTEAQIKARLAWTDSARVAAAHEPALLPVAAATLALVRGTQPVDAARLGAAAAQLRSQVEAGRAAAPGNDFDATLQALRLMPQAMKTVSSAAPAATLEATGTVLAPSTDGAVQQADWRAAQAARAEEVLASLHTACQADDGKRAACDAAMKPFIQVSVAQTADEICRAQPALGGCSVLQRPLTAEAVRSSFSTEMEALNRKTSDCIAGKTDCDAAGRQADIDHIQGVVNGLAGAAKSLGFGQEAEDLKAVGSASVKVYEAVGKIRDSVRTFDPALLSALGDWSAWKALAFQDGDGGPLNALGKLVVGIGSSVTDVASAVKTVLALFGARGGGADDRVLAQVAALQRQVAQLRQEMHQRFDRVDLKLDKLLLVAQDGLAALNNKAIDTNTQLAQVRQALAVIDQRIGWLSLNLEAQLSDLSRQDLNQVIGLVSPVDEARFRQELAQVYQYLSNTSIDSVHAGGPARSCTDATLDELNHSLGYNVNYLSAYPLCRFNGAGILGQRVANPAELIFAGQLYLGLLDRYPDYARRSASMVRSHLQQLIDQRFTPVQTLVAGIQSRPDLFPSLIADLKQAAADFQAAVAAQAPAYLRSVSTTGTDLSVLDLFGAPDQDSAYLPEAVRLNRIGPCAGSTAVLTMPDNWRLVFPSHLARNAEALGLGRLDACYEFAAGSANGWTNYQHWKHKVDRYTAWGVLDVQFRSSFNGSLIGSRRLVEPEGSPSLPSSICFWFTTDDIRIAHTQVPAASVLATGWEGTFTGSGWCQDYRKVTGLKKAFGERSTVVFDWQQGDAAGQAAVRAEVQKRLATLRAGFHADVAAQISAAGPVGSAARRLAASALVIQRYLELSTPQTLAANPLLRALFYGSEALPGVQGLAALYGDAARQGGADARVDVAGRIARQADNLQALLTPVLERIRRGELRETPADLASVQVRMGVWVDALAQ